MKHILKAICILIALLALAGGAAGGFFLHTDKAESVCEGVILLDTATRDTGTLANKAVAFLYDTYDRAAGLCSAAAKTLDTGDTVVGRNFDMILSNYPVYLGYTEIEGYYRTVYAANLLELGPTYEECMEKGVPEYIRWIVPYVATDSMNSEGLYMQTNMRLDQKDEEGSYVFACTGTNDEMHDRLNAYELPSYVTMRCKNIEEALELIRSLDIYTSAAGDDEESWTVGFIMADAEGNYGLLELGCNEVRWLPGQGIQTNFYLSEDLGAMQVYKQGLGRYEYLEEHLDDVKTEDDMLRMMKAVRYSELYSLDGAAFDVRSEMAGDEEYLTNAYLEDENNWNVFTEENRAIAEHLQTLSEEEKRDAGCYWYSLYTNIVNCSRKTFTLYFFEKYDFSYVMRFE